MPSKDIHYSDKYTDDTHEYRHVILPSVRQDICPKICFTQSQLWYNAGYAQKGSDQQTDDGDRVEEAGGPAESRLGAVHDPRPGASHPSLQESSGRPPAQGRLNY